MKNTKIEGIIVLIGGLLLMFLGLYCNSLHIYLLEWISYVTGIICFAIGVHILDKIDVVDIYKQKQEWESEFK